MNDVAPFLSPEQIEQVQQLCNSAANSREVSYVIIEIGNNHPRNFWVTAAIKPILPQEIIDRYKKKSPHE